MITPFLKYVAEGRVVRRQSDLQRYTFQEITERIYLSFLTLSLLKNFSQTKGFTKTYANQTLTYGAFDRVRTTSNDLHNMLAVVAGDPEVVKKLANKNAAMISLGKYDEPTSTQVYLSTWPQKNLLRLVPFSRIISARSTKAESLISNAPPSPEIIFFVS